MRWPKAVVERIVDGRRRDAEPCGGAPVDGDDRGEPFLRCVVRDVRELRQLGARRSASRGAHDRELVRVRRLPGRNGIASG